jgi:hypothetical protein
LAKNKQVLSVINSVLPQLPTFHDMYCADSTRFNGLKPESVHLVLCSPPYWTLKDYNVREGQLGYHSDYEGFLKELDKVWKRCYKALVPGGRLICVVGDVCLSRRKNNGGMWWCLSMRPFRITAERLGSTTWPRSSGTRSPMPSMRQAATARPSWANPMNPML